MQNISRIINPSWAASQDEENMLRTLRRGDRSVLNLYFLESGLEGIAIGRTGMPTGTIFAKNLHWDGVRVLIDASPGGTLYGSNISATVIHEIGHWFGLLHTFDGGCGPNGDYINDTPAQSEWSYDTPAQSEGSSKCTPQNSCPNEPGSDPINNFMNYSPDECQSEFTAGQLKRMRNIWSRLRDPATSSEDNVREFFPWHEPSTSPYCDKTKDKEKAETEECAGTAEFCKVQYKNEGFATEKGFSSEDISGDPRLGPGVRVGSGYFKVDKQGPFPPNDRPNPKF
ncbi:hypothetical protein QQS21_011241 [Conoideocrella luteorostrata]|uniref:Peptidase M43 pregnancy-associated plasma-A domain-containing protein n=1 Tax=Conoideocrella luteorostrata TaxID=1105319 RepID=A0AAJ0CDG9_9HYPO|nr:hypothetical protein QQS21_011241 [Conoideocrella luteorostrata]